MRKRTKTKKQKNKFNTISFLIVVAVILFVVIIPFSFSKYVIEDEEIYLQQAESFYFESDIANTDGSSYNLTDWDIEKDYTISFYIANFENSLLYTESDITYTITGTSDVTTIINDSDGNEVLGSQTLTGGDANTKEYNLVIPANSVTDTDSSYTVEITITASSPYNKTLLATFVLTSEKSEESYETGIISLEDKEYDILYITTYEIDEDIEFTYDTSVYILDCSAGILQNATITESDDTGTVIIPSSSLEDYSNYEVSLIKIV